jgi:hypothetical protein
VIVVVDVERVGVCVCAVVVVIVELALLASSLLYSLHAQNQRISTMTTVIELTAVRWLRLAILSAPNQEKKYDIVKLLYATW